LLTKFGVNTLPRDTIAIRGLDQELYHRIFSKAKKDGKRVADLINEALRNHINLSEGNPYTLGEPEPSIQNAGSMTLSRMVILNLHQELGEFHVKNSGRLTLERDVNLETLQCIKGIINTSSGVIRAPRSVYHLIILKSKNHGALEMY